MSSPPFGDLLESVRARLNEVGHFLRQAEQHYFAPDGFKINLNACIQSCRNITFVVQSNKNRIPKFDAWYGPWQSRLAKEPLLKWLVAARNRIVKQGDLKLHSLLRVGLVLSYYDLPHRDYEVPLRLTTSQILSKIKLPKMPPEVLRDAYVRIERRWVANDLIDHELIDVLRFGFRAMSTLVQDLERYLSNGTTDLSVFPSLSESRHVLGSRVQMLRVADGSLVALGERPPRPVPIDTVVQRYGSLPLSELPKDKKPSPRQLAESYISYAAKVLVRDGFHGTIAILFSDHSSRVVVLEPRDNAEKYVLWRRLAEDVREFGATTIAVVGEIWIAQVDTSLPFKRAVDYSTKDEGLKVTVATKNGDLISLVRKFRKKGSEFEFDEIVEESGTPYFLEPIREVWKLPRFDDKAQPTDQDDKSEV